MMDELAGRKKFFGSLEEPREGELRGEKRTTYCTDTLRLD